VRQRGPVPSLTSLAVSTAAQPRLATALSAGLSAGGTPGRHLVDLSEPTDGTVHENLEQLELQMNTIIEDFGEHIEKLVDVLAGKVKGLSKCPPLTSIQGLRVASRLNDLMERFDNLKVIINEMEPQLGDDVRYVGKGVLQLDASLGAGVASCCKDHPNGMCPDHAAKLRMGPPLGLSSAEVDAWYDGLVQTAKEAKKGLAKMKKQAEDNTSAPRTVTDGKMQIPMPIHDLYTRAIAFPSDDDSATYIRKGFWPDFVLENGYSGKPVQSAEEMIKEVSGLGKKFGSRIKVDITKFFESSAGSWIPGRMAGTKIFTIVAQVEAGKVRDTLVDVVFLVRDPKDDGEWKIKRIIHDGSFKY